MLSQDSIDVSQIASVGIYPSVGIARVGNSTEQDGWYYGPEAPGSLEGPDGGFKDSSGAIKRQAARFRVYAFNANKEVLGELNADTGFSVDWSIEVANKKASWYDFMGPMDPAAFLPSAKLRNPLVQPDLPPDERSKLIIRSGVKHLSSAHGTSHSEDLAGQFYGSKEKPTTVHLGEARLDEHGRLVFLPGSGNAKSILDENEPFPRIMTDFDNPDWYDDTCDGWIDVKVSHQSGKTFQPLYRARVIGTTPKYTSGLYAPTTLFDLMEDIHEQRRRDLEGPNYDVGEVSWHKHIKPLLECAPMLSWVNTQANLGHGPNGPGNFFDPKWQATLSDPTPESKSARESILGRMRLPYTNEKYLEARNGQGFPYFMPPLSGYNDRTRYGEPSTFASVTELQYDRLVKWSKGEFTVIEAEATKHARIEDIPLQEQPIALTKAALDTCIGAPLFPGIEVSWNAEVPTTYQPDVPFVFNDTQDAGDLSKFLSLPWQSDFYMCRNYWWPSVRPDTIVTEDEYLLIAQSVKPKEISKQLNNRVPWERGIPQDYTDDYVKQPYFGNGFMAEHWHELGFIVPRPSFGPEPIFVEAERKLPEDLPYLLPPHPATSVGGGHVLLPTPQSVDCPIQTVDSLKEHLEAAMMIELATIPLYLSGMYSVKIPDDKVRDLRYRHPVVETVKNVVSEEMLHLSLAGNILRAVGGNPRLYDSRIIPTYPMLLPGREPDLELHLKPLDKEQLGAYLEVELPSNLGARMQPGRYSTIGEFYDAIKKGLVHLDKQEKALFDKSTAGYQFTPGKGYQPLHRDAGGSIVVTDLKSALEAIDIIIDQGEGNPGPYDDEDHLEKDHYDIFKELHEGAETWENWPIRHNAKTHQYWREDKRIYHLSLTFDAAYCFLLITIEKLWTIKEDEERRRLIFANMFGVMMGVLAPLARFMVQQPIGDKGEHAAPAFGYYQFRKGESAVKQLQDEMKKVIDSYLLVKGELPDQIPRRDYGAQLEALLPIQRAVDRLSELEPSGTDKVTEKMENLKVKDTRASKPLPTPTKVAEGPAVVVERSKVKERAVKNSGPTSQTSSTSSQASLGSELRRSLSMESAREWDVLE